ncbi:MAG: DUF1640 domain-containing protein [Magnetococcales bacterium]|nr:DUF1640 domain-containing protein [Magnetococcales bacterium]
MTTITFDARKSMETFKDSGFDEKQAQGLVAAIREAQPNNLEELATKGDLAEVKADMIKWVAGMFIAQSALIVGAVFTLFRAFSSH